MYLPKAGKELSIQPEIKMLILAYASFMELPLALEL